MSETIKGPAVYVAQFINDAEPFNTLEGLCRWASGLGYRALQLPTWDNRIFDLKLAAGSDTYCEECLGILSSHGLELAEICSYLQGQIIAVPPAYEKLFQAFYPRGLNDKQRCEWASEQLMLTISASVRLRTKNISVLSGGFAWPYIYPWPQRPDGFIDEAFAELSRRWSPILKTADEHGMTLGFELHPGSDLHDGVTFEKFFETTGRPGSLAITYDPSHLLLQRMDYLEFIRIYHDKISCFHVKDAEYVMNGRSGVYGGFQSWEDRPGRFRSLGDGQIDFKSVFSLLTQFNYAGWAVLEWECCLKSPEQGAREGAEFIGRHIIETARGSFDDFVKIDISKREYKNILGFGNEV